MTTAVRSARVGRGTYTSDREQPAIIRALPNVRLHELEIELRRSRDAQAVLEANAEAAAEARAAAAFEDGRKAGRAENQKKVETAVKAIGEITAAIHAGVDKVWADSQHGVTRLSVEIARAIVGQAAEAYESLATDLAKRCLQQMRDQSRVVIAVNPADAATVRAAAEDLKKVAEGVKDIEVVERASVSRGGVVVETDAGQLDARIEEQLKVIEAHLLPTWTKS